MKKKPSKKLYIRNVAKRNNLRFDVEKPIRVETTNRVKEKIEYLKLAGVDSDLLYTQMKEIILYSLSYVDGISKDPYYLISFNHDGYLLSNFDISPNSALSKSGEHTISYRFEYTDTDILVTIDGAVNQNYTNVTSPHMTNVIGYNTFFYVKKTDEFLSFSKKVIDIMNSHKSKILNSIYQAIMEKTGGLREKNLKTLLDE